jgi:hypothetical protein
MSRHVSPRDRFEEVLHVVHIGMSKPVNKQIRKTIDTKKERHFIQAAETAYNAAKK